MMFDHKLLFCEAKALNAAADSDVLDFGQEHPNLGSLAKLFVVLTFPEDGAGSGAKVAFELQDSADKSDFAAVSSVTLDAASCTGQVILPLPVRHRRYLKLKLTPSGSVTAGKVTAVIADSFNLPPEDKIQGIDPVGA